MKILMILIVLFVIAIVSVLIGVAQIEKQQARANQKILKDQSSERGAQNKVVVVVFSRSGNTAVLGRDIATRHGGNFIRLQAEDYEPGLVGLSRALMDARGNVATIIPKTVDLSPYDTIYLGSPIWLYSPSPPIWEFVNNNSFTGKRVVLFNSFNSKFEQRFINEFEQLVKDKGAVTFEHRFVKRGRMLDQISTEELLERYKSTYDSNEQRK
ncbi:flavodoxin/nitric oxide synthase [Oleiphilus messinensis]|uniref:Flavodoxin/nitric oxide synthase n=1 Tax=Oleiphilus messinensis TaxID=141451 RepID=A0A1Y0IAP9_9GAMM|nr:hypothetical protein [Oleiphilus messinensis]ARU56473.1 flavodoxin/nitric oxide synthase [Oleiphilus messinensis]